MAELTRSKSITRALREHWPEYLMEAAGLGLFMVSAGLLAILLESPHSAVHRALPSPLLRRALMGTGIGATAIALIYSPWGQRSGAHLNPAVTLTFLRLGKVGPWDAAFYALFQVAGGTAGVVLVAAMVGEPFAAAPVRYVATVPGPAGPLPALVGEIVIAFVLMSMVLWATNSERFHRFVGAFAGLLLAFFIFFEAPFSGMSLNPARSFASALPSGLWSAFWIYLLAPAAAMLAASQVYLWRRGASSVRCAKLNHHTHQRCIFRCGYSRKGSAHP